MTELSPEEIDDLQRFKRQYFQLLPIQQFQWPASSLLKKSRVQAWVYSNLFDQKLLKYSPPERYQIQILKQIISRIESVIDDSDEDAASDDLASAFAVLISTPLAPESTAVQQRSYVTYTFSDVSGSANCGLDAVTLLESGSVFAASGITGFRTWEAAPRFGSFLCSENGINYVRGKQVLELGAGTGLVAILCAKILGASYVLATDGSDTVIETLEENLFLNGLDDKRSIDTRILKWGQHFEDDENDKERKFDVVLGADLTYDPTLFPALVSTFRLLLALNPLLEILIAATIRNEDTFAKFLSTCEQAHLSIVEVSFTPPTEDEQTGPFYSTEIPNRILKIRYMGNISADPFAC